MFNSLRARFTLLFAALGLALIALAVIDEFRSSHAEDATEKLGNEFNVAISAILNADRDLYQAKLAELQLITSADTEAKQQRQIDAINENLQQAQERMQSFLSLMQSYPQVEASVAGFDAVFSQWQQDTVTTIKIVQTGNTSAAMAHYLEDSNSHFSALRKIYNAAGEAADLQAHQVSEEANSYAAKLGVAVKTITVLMVLFALLSSFFGPRLVAKVLDDITQKIKALSQGDGDLTRRLKPSNLAEIDHLVVATNEFIAQLQQMFATVVDHSSSLSNQVEQLDEQSGQTSELIHYQGQSVEQIVTAVNEMAASVREVASLAQETAHEIDSVSGLTDNGAEVLQNAVNKINQLSTSVDNAVSVIQQLEVTSNNITSVLHVISEIAEQTNLLALNAAIESARAGEQGRGFAVVADEVRTLAGRTEQSTKDIQKMIDALQQGVKTAVASIKQGAGLVAESVALSQQTHAALEQIRQSTERVNQMSVQTASATDQQANVTEEISRNLVDLADRSQATISVVDSSRNAIGSAASLGHQLKDVVVKFKV
ncbi:methyl-accepting chemotaxis protein [Shewanella sp.]|uniref:methyl-accepting chemotaxis protein n=1 Tax=Shewanella sp. TaxID=50422 RepID=UPI003A97B025